MTGVGAEYKQAFGVGFWAGLAACLGVDFVSRGIELRGFFTRSGEEFFVKSKNAVEPRFVPASLRLNSPVISLVAARLTSHPHSLRQLLRSSSPTDKPTNERRCSSFSRKPCLGAAGLSKVDPIEERRAMGIWYRTVNIQWYVEW